MRFDYLGIFGSLFSPKSSKKGKRRNVCPNCDHTQDQDFLYCPECGQHARESKITFFSLIGEVFSNVLNLDASLYRSFFWLPIPAYLSKRYVKGERKRYLNPVRFFFFSMLLFFALLVAIIDFSFFEETNHEQWIKIERSEMLSTFESEIKKNTYESLDSAMIDSLRKELFAGVKLPELDTLFDGSINGDSSKIQFDIGEKILRKDLFQKPIDDIIKEYSDKTWFEKLVMGQMIRVSRDFKGALSFFVGNGIWVFVAGIFFLSFVMKFMYLTKKKYLIEHSILLFHTHAFAFVVGIVVLLLAKIFTNADPLEFVAGGILMSFLYVILSIKSYYRQGWIITLFKFLVITFFYAVIMVILMGLVLLLSIIFFN